MFGDFYREEYSSIDQFIDSFAASISSAAVSDYSRWPQYGSENLTAKASTIKSYLHDKMDWLAKQWGTTGSAGIDAPACDNLGKGLSNVVYDLQGRRVKDASKPGVYVYKNRILLK